MLYYKIFDFLSQPSILALASVVNVQYISPEQPEICTEPFMLLPLVCLSAGGLVDGTAFETWVQSELRHGKRAEESHCSHSDSVKRTAGSSTFPRQPDCSYLTLEN